MRNEKTRKNNRTNGLKILISILILFIFMGNTQYVQAAGAPNGIYGNGTADIYIDINGEPYTTYAKIPTWGKYAYGTQGCAWFASARVKELTGVGDTIWSGSSWWNNGAGRHGFSTGKEIREKSIACYTDHVAIVEKIVGDTVYISEGGSQGRGATSSNGYSIIRATTVAGVTSYQGETFLGFVYLSGSGGNTSSSVFTNVFTEGITATNATMKASMDSVRYVTTAGVYFGTDPSNMQKITETINGNAQWIYYGANKWIGTLQSNTTYWYQIYAVIGGIEYKTELQSFKTTSAWTETYSEGITETNAVIKGTTTDVKYATAAGIYIGTDASNMQKVTESINANAKWYTYDLNKWYGVLRPGTTYVYQIYAVYDGVEHRSDIHNFTTTDNTNPTISVSEITDISATGYTVRCMVNDNGSIARVCFPTWTDANGQDDLIGDWYNNATVYYPDENGYYTFRVNISDHNNEGGKYVSHIYVYDMVGNNVSKELVCEIYPLQSIGLSFASKSVVQGEQFNLTVLYNPSNTTEDKNVSWSSSNANVAEVTNGTVNAVGVGTATITATVAGKTASCEVTVNAVPNAAPLPDANYMGWNVVDGKSYWYEHGIKQGTYADANGVMGDGSIRGREIYDPGTDGWYWLDAAYDGAKAANKEVWMPYIYQNEDDWNQEEIARNANASGDMAQQVIREINASTGKWVRYDEYGKMVKGWYTVEGDDIELYPEQAGNTYYYDPKTGLMAKGYVQIGGQYYYFDETTGVLQ